MRNPTTLAMWTTGVLLAVSCQTHDLAPTPVPESTHSASTTACTPDLISFTGVAPGTLVTSVTSDGGAVVGITSDNPHYTQPLEAAVFQSSPTVSSTEDYDLGSPAIPNGPGGTPNPGYPNTVPLGNILVLQNFRDYPTLLDATHVKEPNDDDFQANETPGTIGFDFSSLGTVTVTSLTVIDVEFNEGEYGSVQLYASKGGAALGGPILFHDAGSNGVETVKLGDVAGVGYLQVTVGGSLGLDNLCFCRPTTPPPPGHCTYTQGYWKNHPAAWPVLSLTLGGISYTQAELLAIFNTPVRGNGLLALAHQLIAAKLNLANGSAGTAITTSLAQADALFVGQDLRAKPQPSVPTSRTSSLTGQLDDYNSGRTGPGHCD